ncbi:uncharacterized protein LOC117328333 [Pecten maximus]|uniref:uncharacterized protein LOC117328333 n=1 Tax=Pecten maximus TaxID=6579 RepID=UPI0014590A1E|nr:uncharacterized protein LOC117328333 [Pecten maximus]
MEDQQQTETLVPKGPGKMKLDEVLDTIGQFGRYQKFIFVLICIPGISCGIVMTLAVILLGIPNHRCSIPGYENDTYAIQDPLHQEHVARYIPPPTDDTSLPYDKCHLYSYNATSTRFDNSSHPINATLVTCTSWVYDDSEFYETFVSKHDLVCGNHYKVSTAKTIFFGGVLVGALIFGSLSDGLGRKKTINISMALLFASSIGLAWAPNYIAYVILRFLAGMAFSGTFITAYVIGVEIVGPSKRKYTGIINEIFFAFGECFLAGVGFLVRDWHYVEIIIAAPMVLYLAYWWLIPESPRWLINKGRFDEAEEILRKAAKINKKELPSKQILDRDMRDDTKTEKVYKIFTSRVLFIRTLIILYNWMVVSMTYYGLTLNSGNLSGDVYLNFFFSGMVEFPAYIISIVFLDRLGRRTLHCIMMLAGGVACLSTIFTVLYGGKDLQILTTVLALIGKLGSSAGFALIYIYSAELFPTVLRNAAIGIFSCGARVGGMVAPLIADSVTIIGGKMGQAIPLVIFGAASVLAGILTLFLPETLNTRLPETIEDARLFGTEKYNKQIQRDIHVSPDEESTTKFYCHFIGLIFDPAHYYQTKFEEILGIIGEFGFYQKCVFLMLCFPPLVTAMHLVMSVFALGIPDHRCAIPGYPNDTFAIQSPSHEALVKRLVPPSTDETLDYAKCDLYDRSYDGDDNSTDLKACSSWVYDRSVYINTFTSEHDIVCNDKLKTTHAQMIYFGGVMVGSVGLGSISDIIGRKKTLHFSFLMLLGTTLGLAWAPDFVTFCVLRFLIGVSCAGVFMTAFVISIVLQCFSAAGLVILGGIGYAFGEWKSIEIAAAVPSVVFLFYWWFIPESPRWLISQGKIEEANKIIQKAAKVNKVTIPEKILNADSIEEPETGRLWHLFTSRVLLIRTLIIFFNWGVVSLVYYGLSLNTGNLGGDFYVNFLLTGLVEFPAYALCLVLLDRVGRRLLHASCMIVGGAACVITIFPMLYAGESLQPITVTLAMLGKVGAAAAFAVIYVWSAELYPTVVRNAGMGASSSCARIGSMIAPYIADLSQVVEGNLGRAVPLLIFGTASVVAGIMSLWLPETKNSELSETLEDGKRFGRQTDRKQGCNLVMRHLVPRNDKNGVTTITNL